MIENVPPNEWLAFLEALAEDDHQVRRRCVIYTERGGDLAGWRHAQPRVRAHPFGLMLGRHSRVPWALSARSDGLPSSRWPVPRRVDSGINRGVALPGGDSLHDYEPLCAHARQLLDDRPDGG